MYLGQIFEYKNSSIMGMNRHFSQSKVDLRHERFIFMHELFDFLHERLKFKLR